MKNKLLQGGMALLVAIGLGGSAFAVAALPGQYEEVSITVSYADLNIENEADAKKLYSRLQRAAGKACGYKSPTSSPHEALSRGAGEKLCYSEAIASAVEEINAKTLTRIHES